MDPGLRRDDGAYKLKEVPFDASPFLLNTMHRVECSVCFSILLGYSSNIDSPGLLQTGFSYCALVVQYDVGSLVLVFWPSLALQSPLCVLVGVFIFRRVVSEGK